MSKKKSSMRNSLKNSLVANLELPEEIVCNLPLLSIRGNTKIIIENFKNISEYSEGQVKLNTSIGILKVEGDRLYLKELTKTKISISGNLTKIEFI